MILSEKTIREYVEDGKIGIEPEPEEEQFQPASFDLRLGPNLHDLNQKRMHEFDDVVSISPKQPYLGHTIDKIELPNDIIAQVAGRSSVGRRGIIVHMTAGVTDPGFKGDITLEIFNFSQRVQEFSVGERVAQLVFMELDEETEGYDGSYQNQEGPTLSAMEDSE